MRLKNKVAIITGAGSGIGKATAALFAKQGASVLAVDIDEDGLNDTVTEINQFNGTAIAFKADVSNSQEVEKAIAKTLEIFSKIDILVNNAGIFITKTKIADVTEEEYEKTFQVNVKGQFLFAKYCIPVMIKNGGGSIVSTASMSGLVGQRNTGVYNASKAAVILLTKNIALDYARQNIRANCICPGYTDSTKINKDIFEKARENGKEWEDIINMHPMGRVGTPEDMAYGILYLASDESSFVTGATISIDGGLTAI